LLKISITVKTYREPRLSCFSSWPISMRSICQYRLGPDGTERCYTTFNLWIGLYSWCISSLFRKIWTSVLDIPMNIDFTLE
jgi:hypothetical protein